VRAGGYTSRGYGHENLIANEGLGLSGRLNRCRRRRLYESALRAFAIGILGPYDACMTVVKTQAANAAIASNGNRRAPLVLSREELEELTGLTRPSAMCAWLDDHRWVYEAPVRASEVPVIAREYFHRRLVDPTIGRAKVSRQQPNFDFMLRPAGAKI
jgi:hypothetical protein